MPRTKWASTSKFTAKSGGHNLQNWQKEIEQSQIDLHGQIMCRTEDDYFMYHIWKNITPTLRRCEVCRSEMMLENRKWEKTWKR